MDHQRRDGLEHKVERELVRSSQTQNQSQNEEFSMNPVVKEFELRSRFNHTKNSNEGSDI